MQLALSFLAEDIAHWQRQLQPTIAGLAPLPRHTPIAQLVKSMISARTRDAVSQAAFDRLKAQYGNASAIALAKPETVRRTIADVTFAENKAVQLVTGMRQLQASPHRFALNWLGALPLAEALAWLEQLDGVGRKVSASTLNASTLARPVMIVDTHVLRVLDRLGAIDPHADYLTASETVTAAMRDWDGAAFLQFHVMLKYLGQTVCRPVDPACAACPLGRSCQRRGL